MAAPVYSTDLVTITAAESTADGGTWTTIGGGNIALGAGVDFAMQGTNCIDGKISNAEKGPGVTISAVTLGANDHVFTWLFLATPGLSDSLANAGLSVVLGNSVSVYVKFHVEGNDTYGAGGRVAKCYPVRYRTDANTGGVPYRTLAGSPTSSLTFVGGTSKIVGVVKGSNLGVDAIRKGTGIYITGGETASGRGTFSGAATTNDSVSNRWGVLTLLSGSSYELQGRFVVGQNSSGTPTASEFSDSNKNITLVDTPHSLTDFTQIVIDHASSVFNLTNISIEAAGTNNKGKVVFNNAATSSLLSGCTFAKMDTFTLRAGVTASSCTWRNSGAITQNGAVIADSQVASSSAAAALIVDSINNVTNTSFVSSGTGHALQGFSTAGSYTLTGLTFSGYSGTSTNAAIYVTATTGTVTLTVSGGNTPSVRSAGASVIVVSGATVTFTGIPIGTDVVILTSGTSTILDQVDQIPGTTYAWGYTGTPTVDVGFIKPGYKVEYLRNLALTTSDSSIPVSFRLDPNYQ